MKAIIFVSVVVFVVQAIKVDSILQAGPSSLTQ